MNRTIIININGIVFHIEEEAYEVLRSYMIAVKKHFGHSVDSHEIVGDIENRIAEMFSERIVQGKNEVITMQDVDEVTAQMGSVSDFESNEDSSSFTQDFTDAPPLTGERKLMRDPDDKIFGGVCSGLGHYFEIDAKWVRFFVILLFVFGGTGFLLYVILWIVMPLARTRADRMAMKGEAPNLRNFKRSFQEEMDGLHSNFKKVEPGIRKGAQAVGNFLASAIILIAKIIGVLFIIAACCGLVVLLISVFASFGFLGANNLAMFPFSVFQSTFRIPMLISSIVVIMIPFLALVSLVIRILFNKSIIGKYSGLLLLAVWIIAIGFTTVYATKTMNDFREGSTVVEELPLEKRNTYFLSRNDLMIIKLNKDQSDRTASIRQGVSHRNWNVLKGQSRMNMEIIKIDSLQVPAVRYEYSARGSSFETAAERAGRIEYQMQQQGDSLIFDSHFSLNSQELMRDQQVRVKLLIPVGTKLIIDKELKRHIRDLPLNQCENNYKDLNGVEPDQTEWIMTEWGLKCAIAPPPAPEPAELPEE